jgi:PKD repeat protein
LDELENVATASADVTLNFDPACLDFDDVGSAEPVAAFTFNPIGAEGCSATVQFIDQSERATSYSWDFGDGTTSQEQNPIHDYTSPFIPSLTYRVLLRVDGPGGSNEIEQSLVVDFGPTCRTVLIEDPGVILGDDIGLIPVQEEPPALIEEFPPTTEEPPVLEFQPTDAQAPPLVEAEIPITVEQQPTANASAVPEEAIDPVIQQTSDAKEPPVLSTPRPSTDEAPTDIAAPLAPEAPDTTTPQ